MSGKDWIWTLLLSVFLFCSYELLSFTYSWIADLIPEPKFLIRMFDDDPNYFMELPLKRNWWVLIGMLLFLFCSVFGEEFWWRGHILPRQEVVHGKWTWLIHGLLWNLFYLFMPWDQIRLLPSSLALPFVAQRLRNTWPGIIAQFVVNMPPLVRVISGVIG